MNKKQREEGGNGMSRMKIGSGIVLLMLFISVTAFAEDLNQKLTDAAVRGQTGYSRRVSQTVHRDMIYVAVPLLSPDGHPLGVVRAARPVRSLQQALQHSYLRTAQGLLLAAAGVAAVSFLVTPYAVMMPLFVKK